MEFCPKCGTVLKQEKEEKKVILKCRKCGYTEDFVLKKHGKNFYKLKPKEKTTIGIKTDDAYKGKNIVLHKCPYCGHDKAYRTFHGVLWGDEDTIEIYKCVKCGKSSREGVLY